MQTYHDNYLYEDFHNFLIINNLSSLIMAYLFHLFSKVLKCLLLLFHSLLLYCMQPVNCKPSHTRVHTSQSYFPILLLRINIRSLHRVPFPNVCTCVVQVVNFWTGHNSIPHVKLCYVSHEALGCLKFPDVVILVLADYQCASCGQFIRRCPAFLNQ